MMIKSETLSLCNVTLIQHDTGIYLKTSGQFSRHRSYAMGYGFDFRQKQQIFLFFQMSRPDLESPSLQLSENCHYCEVWRSVGAIPPIFILKFCIYRVSQEECARLRESVPYVKVYRYNPKHLYLKLNGYGDNGQRSLKL